mmetsp:Transcript_100445/g.139638  ORF Transcript_100445/g.139638 Transcript_100445/m.139638 type:complete len:227 (-) Transcript_100445:348-1028(-)
MSFVRSGFRISSLRAYTAVASLCMRLINSAETSSSSPFLFNVIAFADGGSGGAEPTSYTASSAAGAVPISYRISWTSSGIATSSSSASASRPGLVEARVGGASSSSDVSLTGGTAFVDGFLGFGFCRLCTARLNAWPTVNRTSSTYSSPQSRINAVRTPVFASFPTYVIQLYISFSPPAAREISLIGVKQNFSPVVSAPGGDRMIPVVLMLITQGMGLIFCTAPYA